MDILHSLGHRLFAVKESLWFFLTKKKIATLDFLDIFDI